jgi:cell division protein ZapA (FtsZ GTPase activity inhibitor)
MDKNTYTVTLAGRRFTLSSSEDSEHISRIVNITEESITNIMSLDRRITFETAAAVTALRFAEEIVRLQEDNTRLRRSLDEANEDKTSLKK